MRRSWVLVLVLLMAGAGTFLWQRSQIRRLSGRLSLLEKNPVPTSVPSVAPALPAEGIQQQGPVTAPVVGPAGPVAVADGLRAEERRQILEQYRGVLAEWDLPPATAVRLENLLADRVEAILDIQTAAIREGVSENSAETARAVASAIADITRQIVNLLGPEGYQQFEQLWPAPGSSAGTQTASIVFEAPDDASAAWYETTPYSEAYYLPSSLLGGRYRQQRGGSRDPRRDSIPQPFAPYPLTFAVAGAVVNLANAETTGRVYAPQRFSGPSTRSENRSPERGNGRR